MSWDLVISSKGYRARSPEGKYLTGYHQDIWRLIKKMRLREKKDVS